MRVAIVTPRVSNSARSLASSLADQGHTVQVRRANRSYGRSFAAERIINWGSGNTRVLSLAGVTGSSNAELFNHPRDVNRAADKLNFFNVLNNRFNVVSNTAQINVARSWIEQGHRVYCRTTTRGHSGDGIVVARTVSELVPAPLYTKGVDTHHEFRVHVMDGVVIDCVRKAFRSDVPEEERNRDILNHAAGTIFVRSGRALERFSGNQAALADCVSVIGALDLTFGAVDVIVDRNGQHHILEVNTACGLEGTTLERYTRSFNALITGRTITPWDINEFQGQQQQENNMRINEVREGMEVVFTRQGSGITTLTLGNTYRVQRVGRDVVYVRNSRGEIRPYSPRNFSLLAPGVVETATATPASVAPDIPDYRNGIAGLEQPPSSPARACQLPDSSYTSVGGSVTYNGSSNSRLLVQGQQYPVVEIYRRTDNNTAFLGISVNGTTHRYAEEYFQNGELGVAYAEQQQTTTTRSVNSVVDIQGNPLFTGSSVQVRVSAGGHGRAVGDIGVVEELHADGVVSVTFGSRTIRIRGNRVRRLSQSDVARLERQRRAEDSTQTIEVRVGRHNLRVRESDVQNVREALRRFAV